MQRMGLTGLLVVTAFGLAACGGGGSRELRRNTPVLLEIESLGQLDGFVRNDGIVERNGQGPGVGDLDEADRGLAFRMFYCFPLDEIPEGVTVTSVTLRVFQLSTLGTPYEDLGPLLVDHVDPGEHLDAADFSGGTITSNLGELARGFGRNYANLGVADAVSRDRAAGRSRSWFRLRFPVDSNRDRGSDVVLLDDGEGSRGTQQVPMLEVRYVRP